MKNFLSKFFEKGFAGLKKGITFATLFAEKKWRREGKKKKRNQFIEDIVKKVRRRAS